MALFWTLVLIGGAFCFSWYVLCAESYIQWLKQILEENDIKVEGDRYDREYHS